MGGAGPATGFSGGGQGDMYFMGAGMKGPSTAAGTYMQGFGNDGGFGGGFKSASGPGFATANKYPPSESFDLDIMMPPDIASIDSDISKLFVFSIQIDKLSAMTPVPISNNYGPSWGNAMETHVGTTYPTDFSGGKATHYSNPSNNMGGFRY